MAKIPFEDIISDFLDSNDDDLCPINPPITKGGPLTRVEAKAINEQRLVFNWPLVEVGQMVITHDQKDWLIRNWNPSSVRQWGDNGPPIIIDNLDSMP